MPDLCLLPHPRTISFSNSWHHLCDQKIIQLHTSCPQELIFTASQLQTSLQALGIHWQINASTSIPRGTSGIQISTLADAISHLQGYRLSIQPESIQVESLTVQGAHYGICTLRQMINQCGKTLPCLEIIDYPDFSARGVMLDISRDKVYTLSTLFDLVDMLADWKINQLQLYTEHTFAYLNHPSAWKDASPMTGEDILRLDAYCRQRFIELVPNQNSFGHLSRWLKLPEYTHLAETMQDFAVPWGTHSAPFSLAAANPGSFELVRGWYDELLPHFTSRQCNVGCDETFDLGAGQSKSMVEKLGKGGAYLDFLLKIYRDLKQRGIVMQYWGDMALHHPEILPSLPKDATALIWGYDGDYPFDSHCAQFSTHNLPFYVCPGTSSWCSLAGRTDNCLANLLSAAENGKKHGAQGYLNTDWGDLGHWQMLPVSYLGLAAGASFSWNLDANRTINVPETVSVHAFKDGSGMYGSLYADMGNLYQKTGMLVPNSSILFWILQYDREKILTYRGFPTGGLHQVLNNLEDFTNKVNQLQSTRSDASLLKRETELTFRLLRHACWRGLWILEEGFPLTGSQLKQDLIEIIEEYRSIWLERNRPGGLKDSLARLEIHLKEYD